jgi:hypothetical protein
LHHATLGSGWLPTFAGQASDLLGSFKSSQSIFFLYMTYLSSRLCLAHFQHHPDLADIVTKRR